MLDPVHAVLADFTRAFNAHDPAALAACFTDDADFTDVVGNTVTGPAAIEQLHRFPFSRVLREATLTVDRAEARLLRPDLAVAVAHWSLTGSRSREDEPLPARRGALHVVCTPPPPGSERWQIASALNAELAGIYARQFAPGETLPGKNT